jgi:hypothetical protein
MESLIFLTGKKDRRVKAKTCANSSTKCEYTNKEEAVSPMVLTESHLILAVIDTKQERNAITANILNAFFQTEIEKKSNSKTIIMKIRETLVDMLVNISPKDYFKTS